MKKIIAFLLLLLLVPVVFAAKGDSVEKKLTDMDLSRLPGIIRFLLGKPKINIEVQEGDTVAVHGFKIAGNAIKDYVEGGLDKPHYIIKIDKPAFEQALDAEDPFDEAGKLYAAGKASIEPQTPGCKIKYAFMRWFG